MTKAGSLISLSIGNTVSCGGTWTRAIFISPKHVLRMSPDFMTQTALIFDYFRLGERGLYATPMFYNPDDLTVSFERAHDAAQLIETDFVCDVQGEKVFIKSEKSGFKGTSLAPELREDGKDTLLVTGGYLEECVKASISDALDEGFDVVAVPDLIYSKYYPVTEKSARARYCETSYQSNFENRRGRFFRATSDQILSVIRQKRNDSGSCQNPFTVDHPAAGC